MCPNADSCYPIFQQWTYSCIPVLPEDLLHVHQDTRPYLIGLHSDAIPKIVQRGDELDGIVVLDVDHNHISCTTGLPGRRPLSNLGIFQW